MNYTIEFLASSGIRQIFVLCRSHAAALEAHINSLKGKIGVEVICYPVVGSTHLGEALGAFGKEQHIEQDFVLVYGDVISNQRLGSAIQQHILRREKDPTVLMTLLLSNAVEDRSLSKLRIPHLNTLFSGATSASVAPSSLVTPHSSTLLPIETSQDGKDGESSLTTSTASSTSATARSTSANIVSSSPHSASWMENAASAAAAAAGAETSEKVTAASMASSAASLGGSNAAPRLRDNPMYLTLSSNESKVVVMDEETGQVFAYEERSKTHSGKHIEFDTALFKEHRFITVRNDLQDSGVAICAADIFIKFEDHFDYKSLPQLVRGVINDELQDVKIFAAIAAENSYTNRVSSLRRYHQVTGDVLCRWAFPLVPDTNMMPNSSWSYSRPGIYKESHVHLHRDCKVFPNSAIGEHSSLSAGVVVTQSTIGRHCQIGRNVKINHTFVWDKAVIEDDVSLDHSIVCSGARIGKGSVIGAGCIIGQNVVVGPGVILPPLTKLTSFGLVAAQTAVSSTNDDDFGDDYSDDEDDDNDKQSAEARIKANIQPVDLGTGGVGGKWSPAPMPFNELYAGWETISHLREILAQFQRSNMRTDPQKKGAASAAGASTDPAGDEHVTDTMAFTREVESVVEGYCKDTTKEPAKLTFEINALKYAHNRSFLDCMNAIFFAFLKNADSSAFLKSLVIYLKRFSKVFNDYLLAEADRREFLFALEDFCEQEELYTKQFTNILNKLYDLELLPEDTFLGWADEHEEDEEEDESPLYASAKTFIDWLREEDEEDEEDDEE